MKKLFSVLLLLFIGYTVHAQIWGLRGAKWHYQEYCTSLDTCGYFTVEVHRDTTISNMECPVLGLYKDGVLVPGSEVITLKPQFYSSVFFFENGWFKMLYDFDSWVGDTIYYSIPHNWHYYDFTCSIVEPDTTKEARAIIDSVRSFPVNNKSLTKVATTPITDGDTNYFDWTLGNYYSTIGSDQGLFGNSLTQCQEGYPGHFRCYADQLGFSYKISYEDCDHVTSTVDPAKPQKHTRIFPNPASDKIYLDISGLNRNKEYQLNILTISGQLVKVEKFRKTSVMPIFSLENLSEGIYLYRLISADNKESEEGKIVIIR